VNIRSTALAWYRQKYNSAGQWIKASRFYPANLSWTKAPAWAFLIPLDDLRSANAVDIELLCQKQLGLHDFHVLKVPCSYLLRQLPHLDVRTIKSGDANRLFLETAGTGRFTDHHVTRPVSLAAFLVP
jgi:hypothetical protein